MLGEAEMCTGNWDLPQGTGSNPSCAAESPARPRPAMLAQVACIQPASVCFKETRAGNGRLGVDCWEGVGEASGSCSGFQSPAQFPAGPCVLLSSHLQGPSVIGAVFIPSLLRHREVE